MEKKGGKITKRFRRSEMKESEDDRAGRLKKGQEENFMDGREVVQRYLLEQRFICIKLHTSFLCILFL